MLAIKNWSSLSAEEKKQCLARAPQVCSNKDKVLDIINQVRSFGDKALLELTQALDRVTLSSIQMPLQKIQEAQIDAKALSAIEQAIETITLYHQALIPEPNSITTAPGIRIEAAYRPIQKVGLYVPGGNKTPLISSLLMQAIPAAVAGCPIKVLCTPPDAEGQIDPHLLVAARLCGIETIYTLGGAQAIAALAYGTETVIQVDKIFGPGNSFVTQAKTLVASDPEGAAIDMPAGPSEVMVLAEDCSNASFVAADLLAQAEHGSDSQVFLICQSLDFSQKVHSELNRQFLNLSRQNLIRRSLAHSKIIVCPDEQEQIQIINSYAPEHLIVHKETTADWMDSIRAVGTVFLGPWAAETMGDYVTGSNHVLPTNGFAKNHSGLGTLDFLTRFTVQSITEEGILNLGPAALTLAELEGLDAHAQAVQIRLNMLEV